MIKNRSIGLVILLSLVTFGFYPIILYCKLGSETNKICDGDGKHNMHYLLAVLLGMVTFGIYTVLWAVKAMNRLQDNAYRYGALVKPPNTGTSFALWIYLGAFIGVGPFVAMVKFVQDVNAFAGFYGCLEPLPYTDNMVERLAMSENNKVLPQVNPQVNAPQQQNQPQLAQQNQPQPQFGQQPKTVDAVPATVPDVGHMPVNSRVCQGSLIGQNGMYAGFSFPLLAGEEIIIGTNPQVSSIVVSENGRFVSGKHCSIKYDATKNSYMVVDYSSNGTFDSNMTRLQTGVPSWLNQGQLIYLGTTDNSFRLG